MTWVLLGKLLRDVRRPLAAVALLLFAFQFFWAKVTERVLGKLAPFFVTLGEMGGLSREDLEAVVFEGPAKIMRTIIGGERISLDKAMDMMSIGYVHPLMQTVFCIWAVGRAAGAIAGEIDRGTMELLLAQPLRRSRVILAHLLLDLITIPILCLAMWAGTCLGTWFVTPIQVEDLKLPTQAMAQPAGEVTVDIFLILRVRFEPRIPAAPRKVDPAKLAETLRIEPMRFLRGLVLVAGLIFAICGATMWLSAAGRSRNRVLGIAVFLVLLQFLFNVMGQMWEDASWIRPLTIFYYYQPQQVILGDSFRSWCVTLREWNGGDDLLLVPMPLVLFVTGAVGYLMAWRTLERRDLPAPL